MSDLRVGMLLPAGTATTVGERRPFLARVDASTIDHICCGDHVSFFTGFGRDGLVDSSSLLSLTDRLVVKTAVYLLPLRHPVTVARQVADLAAMAPGRFVFGVGLGGEDPHELEICGVDPRTRGRRMDEGLAILRSLLDGKPTTVHGEFYDMDDALVMPAPPADAPVPIIVGGRSDAALRRVGRYGDGWLAIWLSPGRFATATELIAAHATDAGRQPPTEHALQVWCGFGEDRSDARQQVASAMEAFYTIPFERFEKYTPFGTPTEVADFLRPYVEHGCTSFNLIPCASDPEQTLEAVEIVRQQLLV